MKFWPYLFVLLFMHAPSLWAREFSLQNDREGKSLFDTKSNVKKIDKVLKKANSRSIENSYHDYFSATSENSLCAFDFNQELAQNLKLRKTSESDVEGATLYLRARDLLDDVSTQILLNALKVSYKKIFDTTSGGVRLQGDLQKIQILFSQFSSRYLQRHCYDEAYRLFHSDLKKIITFSESTLKDIFIQVRSLGFISKDIYEMLERARLSELHIKNLSLKDYAKKKSHLRVQYPISNPAERSDFVTVENPAGLSHRQQLFLQYNEIQIILMSNLIKKLRTRLESDRIEILIYDDEGRAIEVIPLEPMERFRFSLKLLRKEMGQLALNSQFNNRAPSYMDLIAASFETGLVAGSELNELGGLEEIWNPKKTFWDKASFWVRSFSSVATVLIPPPYGFVPVLALVAIEASQQGKNASIDDGSLF